MRIYGNREIKTLPGLDTRPTPVKVREAIFNIWQGSIAHCRWLDLCTGSGAMGAEALCRGAELVVGIERSKSALDIIEYNWRKVSKPEQTWRVIRGDILKKLPTLVGEQFHHIYFDPPYQSDLYLPVMSAIAEYALLTTDGELAVEHHPHVSLPIVEDLVMYKHKTYGNTAIAFYRNGN
jgi:16S rRNA (guanine(966)-N(2))-methyltransferase RsmD